MIVGFSHVQIVVTDVEASVAWFRDVLGLEQFTEGSTATGPYAALRHRTARFVIGLQTAAPGDGPQRPGATIDHLAFAVADRDALEAWRAELLARSLPVSEIFEEAVSYNARIASPDGLTLELTAPKSPSP